MRITFTAAVRRSFVTILAAAALLATVTPASAQGFGIGARMAWVKSDTEVDVDAVRFLGGQIRLGTGRVGLEVSMDYHSASFEELNQKIAEWPVQASLLLRLGGGAFSPYLLGGPGWYRRTVEPIDSVADAAVSATEFGWHAGGGLEIRGGHFGVHGDYRYTFLDFGDDEGGEGLIGRVLPGHKGSMWTLGATVYF